MNYQVNKVQNQVRLTLEKLKVKMRMSVNSAWKNPFQSNIASSCSPTGYWLTVYCGFFFVMAAYSLLISEWLGFKLILCIHIFYIFVTVPDICCHAHFHLATIHLLSLHCQCIQLLISGFLSPLHFPSTSPPSTVSLHRSPQHNLSCQWVLWVLWGDHSMLRACQHRPKYRGRSHHTVSGKSWGS